MLRTHLEARYGVKRSICLYGSPFVWKELLEDIKFRGIEEILLFISNGLKGIPDKIFSVYLASSCQTCCAYLSRTIARKVRVSTQAEICEDFKPLYRTESLEMSQQALHSFVKKIEVCVSKSDKTIAQ